MRPWPLVHSMRLARRPMGALSRGRLAAPAPPTATPLHCCWKPAAWPVRSLMDGPAPLGVSTPAAALQALAQKIATDAALAEKLAAQPAAAELLRTAGYRAATAEPPQEVAAEANANDQEVHAPSMWQMKVYCLHNFIPFIGFGFFDNFIMILAGDLIDAKLGITLGITTMAAAAIGNTFSDVVGLWVSGFIETTVGFVGIPDHDLSNAQRRMMRVRILKNTSMIAGLVMGCTLGMVPLVYPTEWRIWPSRTDIMAELADDSVKQCGVSTQ